MRSEEKLPRLLVPSLAAYADRRQSVALDDEGALKRSKHIPNCCQAVADVPGPLSMLEVLVAAFSLADMLETLAPGDAGGSGGGPIFCEVSRVEGDKGCRGLNGEEGTELRSGAICL